MPPVTLLLITVIAPRWPAVAEGLDNAHREPDPFLAVLQLIAGSSEGWTWGHKKGQKGQHRNLRPGPRLAVGGTGKKENLNSGLGRLGLPEHPRTRPRRAPRHVWHREPRTDGGCRCVPEA